jgi:hypothetical protein
MRLRLVAFVVCALALPVVLAAAPPAWVLNPGTPAVAAAAGPPWLTGLGTPAPQAKTCTASRACGDGNTVACTGTYTCSLSLDGVTCDGADTACPNFCSATTRCDICSPPRILTCYSTSGNCYQIDDGVHCGGNDVPCHCPD